MGEVSTVIQKARRDNGAEIGDIVFDCTPSDSHSHTASATSNNVETGAKPGDHVDQNPDELTLDGIFSDLAGERLELNRAADLYDQLVELKESGEPVTVITGLRVYENMVLTAVESTRDASTGLTVPTSCSLQEQPRVDQQLTDIPPPPENKASEVQHTAQKPTNRGRQSAEDAGSTGSEDDQQSEEETKSYAKSIFDNLAGD